MSGNSDKRVRRTRDALLEAFNRLVLDRKTKDIRVGDIVAEANVGRSTFYDHYPSAEALHLDALRRPFAQLADAAAGRGDEAMLTHIFAHFWEYRQRARRSLGKRSERLLVEMVEERLGNTELCIARPLAARQLAAAAHGTVTAWLSGAAPCSPAALARAICRSGTAQVEALSC